MALPLATIRITYPEKLIIQIVKSPVSQDNRRSIAFRKHDTSAGAEGSAPVAPLCSSSRVWRPWPWLSAGWFAGPYQEDVLGLCQLPTLWELEWPRQRTCGEPVSSNWDKS